MNVLSLFDGMSCGRIALERAGIPVTNYFASEIDKYAIQVSKDNWPDIVQCGDVQKLYGGYFTEKIDLLIGGSPCQGFSFAGKGLNFDDPRSKLFFEFVRLKNEINPKYFLLENAPMLKAHQDLISKLLGCEPFIINSSLVSAQERERLYWTNIPFDGFVQDKKIILKDIADYSDHSFMNPITASRSRAIKNKRELYQKASCLLATSYKLAQANGMTNIDIGHGLRCINIVECERLQTVPEGYTKSVSKTQAYKLLGNGWTIDIITKIFKAIRP